MGGDAKRASRHRDDHPQQRTKKHVKTLGFRPTCEHDNGEGKSIALDPFMGSGTVAKVALRANRNFIGIELNQEYIDMAMKRIGPLLKQGNLL
ncbi:site-specific DNA-methyltransferase [Candidatus Pacearchaeota archaeon]|nr:site-specific DNA-methyltransferase [Candidatus Pacearchaeota archaeon]